MAGTAYRDSGFFRAGIGLLQAGRGRGQKPADRAEATEDSAQTEEKSRARIYVTEGCNRAEFAVRCPGGVFADMRISGDAGPAIAETFSAGNERA
jgi:hypothetical protein